MTAAGAGNLAKTGYTFTGWNTSANGSGTPYAPGATFTMSAAFITLYAQWSMNTCTVSFNSDGGSLVGSQVVAYGSATSPPLSPAQVGYSFAGWYTDQALTIPFNFTTPITASITLYAKWATNTYAVSFNGHGGGLVASENIAYHSVAATPASPTKTTGMFLDRLVCRSGFNYPL